MRPQSSKAKGRRLQNHIRDRIRETFNLHEDDVSSRSMGASGEDILLSPVARACVPFSIESKNVQRLNLWAAWEQAVENAGQHNPMVVVSRNRSEVLAVVRFEDLLKMLAR
jgi:hypothetical protein